MEKCLHHIDEYLLDEHIRVNEEVMKKELDVAGVDYVIKYVPVALIETTEREYTAAKTINVKNLLRLVSESTEELMDKYEAEGLSEIIEIGRG